MSSSGGLYDVHWCGISAFHLDKKSVSVYDFFESMLLRKQNKMSVAVAAIGIGLGIELGWRSSDSEGECKKRHYASISQC